MTVAKPLAYSDIVSWRPECHRRFGGVLDLEITTSPYTMARRLWRGGKVLDIGAGIERPLQKSLGLSEDLYFSLDDDPRGAFSYGSFEQIPAGLTFELVVMNQLLEHLALSAARDLLGKAIKILTAGGHLLVSVPNAAHPVRYHADVWHVTNWSFNDLYGLLRHVGFEVVAIQRSNKRPLSRNPLKRWVVRLVCWEFRMDWCDTIILTAKKP